MIKVWKTLELSHYEAYLEAKNNGWAQKLEDICYQNYWAMYDFTTDVYGANLLRYINTVLLISNIPYDEFFIINTLKSWIRAIVNTGINNEYVLRAIDHSKLLDSYKDDLSNYFKSCCVISVMR